VSVFAIPVRRPVATAMFFLGVVLLGVIAWQKLPVELLPPLEGNRLFVNFLRPGSEPEVVEREILLPLAARASELPDVEETRGELRGPGGTFNVRFDPRTDLKVRELELRRLAAELAREQPQGTFIDVSATDLSLASRFAMVVSLSGRSDVNVLRTIADEEVEPRLAAVPGVSQVFVAGGAPREITVHIDPDRCALLGVDPGLVASALRRSVGRLRYLGGVEDEAGRTSVILDGRLPGLSTLENIRLVPERPVLLRHVAEVERGTGRRQSVSRVNGESSVAMIVFKDEGSNLVRLGEDLRRRLDELTVELGDLAIHFTISFDGAELVEERLDRLKTLGASGFLIALLVLFLFLRHWRAVAVVGVAVPVSLLVALALLFLAGQTLNLITIFGLAVGIGMLVDNSIVVYEAVQRRLERGSAPDKAAEEGVRRTVRAILAASLTTIVVFLPVTFIEFEDAFLRGFLRIMTLAIILPLVGSVIVAVGLVPLLARRLAAPAALARMKRMRRRREGLGGLRPPDRALEVFSGMLVAALRRPALWLTGVGAAVLVTVVVALPWVAFSSLNQEAPEANPVQLAVEIPSDASLDNSVELIARLEESVQRFDGVERVESYLQEANSLINGSLTVYLKPKKERPEDIDAARVRSVLRAAARKINQEQAGAEVVIRNPGDTSGGGGGGGDGGDGAARLTGGAPSEIVVSGPEVERLKSLAVDLQARLGSISEIDSIRVSGRPAQKELRVLPQQTLLTAFGLTADQVLPALAVVRREGLEMRIGYTDTDGEEIPLTVRREPDRRNAQRQLADLRVATAAGVLPISATSDVRRMQPPNTIMHHNGRRELSVYYRFGRGAPQTGPGREELEARISRAVQEVHRPPGYTVETPKGDEAIDWFKRILIPAILLLYAVLAITFESLTLPILVLVALPLTVLGATWALVFTGTPFGPMAIVGTVSLIGLTVNPAILLVDRMQQRVRFAAASGGAAALAAVRERVRPVLLTSATTVAGLWPLALVTGEANEIWPPFATVLMGGLLTSTLLTLLVIPVGFVILNRLDRLFGRLGPWIMIGWVGSTAAVMTPLIVGGLIVTLTWKLITTVLVAALLLASIVLLLRRPERPEPEATDGPPVLEVRNLKKIYGAPGPVGYAWRLPSLFAKKVLARGGTPFDPGDARERIPALAALVVGAGYLATIVQTPFWRLVFLFAAVIFATALLGDVRRARGKADRTGRVLPGGPEGAAAWMLPWVAVAWIAVDGYLVTRVESWAANAGLAEGGTKVAAERADFATWFVVTLIVAVLVVQLGRRTAVKLARGDMPERLDEGFLRRWRTVWRRWSRRWFGLDLPREEVRALSHVNFRAERGMIGILGPNGAGKTTLLRQLAGILDPSIGRIVLGGVPLDELRRYLARYVGYLPQDFGLPANLSAREYLDYYALLYEMKPAEARRERVDMLLKEVGLGDRADDKIGSYSGGMRQRVAVARTLLRLPPVIIVDEPTVGLDPRERIRFRNLLSRLAEGRVVLFSTHVVEDVAVACERVIVLARGRMVFDGEPMDLAEHAEGRVWTARLLPEEEQALPEGARVVDHVPEGDGRSRLRILSSLKPHPEAVPDTPSLEDGYLMLT
jgi:multidrug efflux pump subunit AcrB/ABC-type multidrug transport system ATPase subunit